MNIAKLLQPAHRHVTAHGGRVIQRRLGTRIPPYVRSFHQTPITNGRVGEYFVGSNLNVV
ncbi:hypothetical protein AG1IA_02887 [Rhizoctonia solani AG-1 IA]|uniref:Uncharacterized protein n=1 Tax=Thanatephorus cucumeris (strain AG1-IA) TaxID=983506 RepID=L8WYA1_THACA|nr:hypothetical protein AG1IA_02887 [Rhizoctonia solani AG-1 IA]